MSVFVITFDPEAPAYDPPMSRRKRSRFAFDLRRPRSKLPKSMTKSWFISLLKILCLKSKVWKISCELFRIFLPMQLFFFSQIQCFPKNIASSVEFCKYKSFCIRNYWNNLFGQSKIAGTHKDMLFVPIPTYVISASKVHYHKETGDDDARHWSTVKTQVFCMS